MKQQHTPGPWKWVYKGLEAVDSYEDIFTVLDLPECSYPECQSGELVFGINKEANKALIEAAPDLLEAAKAALSLHVSQEESNAMLKAAIKKAEGE